MDERRASVLEYRKRQFENGARGMSLRTFLSSVAVVLTCSLLSSPPAAGATKLWERRWLEVKTEHFVIASALPERRSVELAVELENFRTMARALMTNDRAFEERIPTLIYLLPGVNRDLGIDGEIAGYFAPGMRANYAVMMASGELSDEILKHEYIHYLVHNNSAQLYPAWFDEGFAEVMSTLSVKDRLVEYGKPLPQRVEILGYGPWMPFTRLLRTRSPRDLGVNLMGNFYAQSWLLVQYLMLGRDGHSFSTEAADFLRHSEAGEQPVEAFEAAFGIAPVELENLLNAYTRRVRYYKTELAQPLPIAPPKVRTLAADEIAAQLGLIALLHGRYEAAEELYSAALAANARNGIALAGMGDVNKHAERYEQAVGHYERAVAAEPTNSNHELDWGEYFLQRAAAEADAAQRRAFLADARRHFARSYAINPQNPETLDQNGLTYLFDGEDGAKAVQSLEAAYDLLPSYPGIQFDLAQAYLKTGERAAARALVTRVVTWIHAEPSPAVQELLASLQADAPPAEGNQDAADTAAAAEH